MGNDQQRLYTLVGERKLINTDHPAIVLNMYETGLGVGRSLGRNGIQVVGVDCKKDIAFYSRYINAFVCPHPLDESDSFLQFMISLSKKFSNKPVLFSTADDFILAVSRMRNVLSSFYLFNIPLQDHIETIIDKRIQYKKAEEVGIPIPKTFSPESIEELDEIHRHITYPVFIKACYSYMWKKHFGTVKGFVAENKQKLSEIYEMLNKKKLTIMIQEIIPGPDTNHFKYCCYVSKYGEMLLSFTLQKIRQHPIRFGIGAAVKSIHYPDLMSIGARYFTSIGYRGVGSAEFKLDERDGNLKLIELNPRYWQQNMLSDRCGMNFPLIDYLECTGQKPKPIFDFRDDIKWVNIYMDFSSYLSYRNQEELTFHEWLSSLRGAKVFSDFALDDILPAFYEIRFGKRLFKIPQYILKKLKNGD